MRHRFTERFPSQRLVAPKSLLLCWAVALVGVVERLAFALAPASIVNSDEAITSLTAISVAKGEFPLIVGGNNYGGVAEAYIFALPIAVMRWLKLVGGASLMLDCMNIALHALLFWALYRVCNRFLSRTGALLLIAPAWLMSSTNIVLATQSYLGYVTGALAAVLSVGLLMDEKVADLQGHRKHQTMIAGLLAGFAFWQHPIVGVAPLAVLTVGACSQLFRYRQSVLAPLFTTAVATILGASPFIWRSVAQWDKVSPGAPLESTFSHRLRIVFSEHIPRSLGLRTIDGHWLVGGMGIWVPTLIAIGLAVAVAVAVRRGRWAALGMVLTPVLVAAAPSTIWVIDGRYGFLIALPLLILVAAALQGVKPIPFAFSAAALAVVGVVGFASIGRDTKGFQWREPDVLSLVGLLDSRGVTAVRGDYWIAYRIAHVSSERIPASDWDLKRIPRLERRVLASKRLAYVLTSPAAEFRIPSRETLERVESGTYIVYLPMKRK